MHVFAPDRLREERKAKSIPVEQLALDIGRSAATISFWERGHVTPNARQLGEIASILRCSPADFFRQVSE